MSGLGRTAQNQDFSADRTLLDALPRLGWVGQATPVQRLAELEDITGASWLGVKRDDRCEPTSGGNKARKLDFLLAAAPWQQAPTWTSAGAIGSGHLVCCGEAATLLGRGLVGHLFWEPASVGVHDNLAATASLASELRYSRSRVMMAVRSPAIVLGGTWRGMPVIPPGGSNAIGTLGMVRAGLELAEQVRAGVLPEPDIVYVAFGSGGTAAGIALGLALGGLRSEVRAIAVVERLLAPTWRLQALVRATVAHMVNGGLRVGRVRPRLRVVRGFVGPGYGIASEASLVTVSDIGQHGLNLEPIYTGKAMAALLAQSPQNQRKRVLFWHTRHRKLPPPLADWRDRLPAALRSDLDGEMGPNRTSRRLFLLGTAGFVAVGFGYRLLGYDVPPDWQGTVLSAGEAGIIYAAAEALLPAAAQPHLAAVVTAVDRYLIAIPPPQRRLCISAFGLVEHATLLSGRCQRMSRLAVHARLTHIGTLMRRGGEIAQAAKALRDVVLLGWYQQAAAWPTVSYEGPRVPKDARAVAPRYARLVAERGAEPAFSRRAAP